MASSIQLLKSAIGSISYYTLAIMVARAGGFFLLPVWTYFLSPSEYGIVGLSETIGSLLMSAVGLGLPALLLRTYYNEGKSQSRSVAVASVFYGAVGAIVAFGAVIAFVAYFAVDAIASVAIVPYVLCAIMIGGSMQLVELLKTLFQALHMPARYAVVTCLAFLLAAASTLLGAFYTHGADGYLFGRAAGFATAILFCYFVFARKFLPSLKDLSFSTLRGQLPVALPLVPHMLTALALTSADRFIIAYFGNGKSDVGLYTLGYSLGSVMAVVTQLMMLLWAPRFYAWMTDERSRWHIKKVLPAAACLMCMLFAAGHTLVPLVAGRVVDSAYLDAVPVSGVVMLGYLLHGIFSLWHLSMIQAKRTYLIALVSAIAVIVNIVLNLWWIPKYGIEGAAWATVCAYAVEALIAYAFALRLYKIRGHELLMIVCLTSAVVGTVANTFWVSVAAIAVCFLAAAHIARGYRQMYASAGK